MHKIEIPAYALRLAQARGELGRGLAPIDSRRTALLVIDMQDAFVSAGAALAIPFALEIVPAINGLAGALRSVGGKVCWLQTDFEREAERWSYWFQRRLRPAASRAMIAALTPGRPGYDLFGEMAVAQGDMRCVKTRFSPFIQGSSQLDEQLRALEVDTVIVTGTVSNTCCETTARDAMMLNYRTIFVTDANAARTDEEHNATLGNMLQTFAEIASAKEVVGALA
jgi:ureidoacrylate peracid hydrolase